MAKQLSEEQIYEEARKRVKAKRGFWGHFITYAVVNIICFFIWAVTGGGYPWFLWVLGPWGIVIIFPQIFTCFCPWREIREKSHRKRSGEDKKRTRIAQTSFYLEWFQKET